MWVAANFVRKLRGVVEICKGTIGRWWMIGAGLGNEVPKVHVRNACLCIRVFYSLSNNARRHWKSSLR